MAIMEWQKIETAPKDGTTVLVYPTTWDNKKASTASFSAEKYAKKPRPYWKRDDALGLVKLCRDNPSTHWAELPDPPEEG